MGERLFILVALVAAAIVAGCGGDEGGEEPQGVADGRPGATNELRSGFVDGSVELSFAPRGAGQADTGRIAFSGPFETGAGDRLPSFDLAVRMEESGEEDVDFGMIATPDAGYIEYQDQGYEIDQAIFERLSSATPFSGLDATRWFTGRSSEGHEEIDGAETIHASGDANVERIIPDLAQAARAIGLRPGDYGAGRPSYDEATLDLFTGADDGILRRLDLRIASHGKSEDSGRFNTVFDFSATVNDVNEDVEIEAPSDSLPFSELVPKLPLQLSGLGEFLSRTR